MTCSTLYSPALDILFQALVLAATGMSRGCASSAALTSSPMQVPPSSPATG